MIQDEDVQSTQMKDQKDDDDTTLADSFMAVDEKLDDNSNKDD